MGKARVPLTVLLPRDLRDRFKRKCREDGLTMSTVLRTLIRMYAEGRLRLRAVVRSPEA